MISPQDDMRLPSSFVSQSSTHFVQLAVSRARQHLTHPASLARCVFYLADISAIKIAIGSFYFFFISNQSLVAWMTLNGIQIVLENLSWENVIKGKFCSRFQLFFFEEINWRLEYDKNKFLCNVFKTVIIIQPFVYGVESVCCCCFVRAGGKGRNFPFLCELTERKY